MNMLFFCICLDYIGRVPTASKCNLSFFLIWCFDSLIVHGIISFIMQFYSNFSHQHSSSIILSCYIVFSPLAFDGIFSILSPQLMFHFLICFVSQHAFDLCLCYSHILHHIWTAYKNTPKKSSDNHYKTSLLNPCIYVTVHSDLCFTFHSF